MPPGIRPVVKERQEFFLQLRRQVDEQGLRQLTRSSLVKGRGHDDVLRPQRSHVPDGPCYLVAVLQLDEEPLNRSATTSAADVGREHTRAGCLDGVLVQIGREESGACGFWPDRVAPAPF